MAEEDWLRSRLRQTIECASRLPLEGRFPDRRMGSPHRLPCRMRGAVPIYTIVSGAMD